LSTTPVATASGITSCGATADQWVGTFSGVLHSDQTVDRDFRAVIREGGPNVLIDSYMDDVEADTDIYQQYTLLEEGDTLHWRQQDPAWNSNTHLWARALTCDGNGVTSAKLNLTIFWLSWILYDGTITRTA
jgi:hypothetical protein